MLRLRMAAGVVTKDKLNFVVHIIEKYHVSKISFTTRQSIQIYGIEDDDAEAILQEALEAGINTFGAGKESPRNVMCAPLSGVEKGEYLNVKPYALCASDFLSDLKVEGKMPRRLKACFSNSPSTKIHAIYSDLGFVANPNGKFDVYSAGGLGKDPSMGVLVKEDVEPEDILYHLLAMWMTFKAYADPVNPIKAKTRYMPKSLGIDKYKEIYLERLEGLSILDLKVKVEEEKIQKQGDGSIAHRFVHEQKQEGLYYVEYHPIGGVPDIDTIIALNKAISQMDEVEIRLAPDETAYIINLTAQEAYRILDIIHENQAKSLFEASISCRGVKKCRLGIMDSAGMLSQCIKEISKEHFAYNTLPQIHISGCISSCGTHQTGYMGLRGSAQSYNGKLIKGYILCIGNKENAGIELGMLLEEDVIPFLKELGHRIYDTSLSFEEWIVDHYEEFEMLFYKYNQRIFE